MEMANTLIDWFKGLFTSSNEVFRWLVQNHPFENLKNTPFSAMAELTPLSLISLSGLLIFLVVAIVLWLWDGIA